MVAEGEGKTTLMKLKRIRKLTISECLFNILKIFHLFTLVIYRLPILNFEF